MASERPAPAPASVWMVHKQTGRAGVQGQLTLEDDRVIFRPDLRGRRLDVLGETVFALHEVRSASRSKLSPVLELRVTTPNVPSVILFYFVKPPDRYSSPFQDPRSSSAFYLANSGVIFEEEVRRWEQAIKDAKAPRSG